MKVPEILASISDELFKHGASAFLVGGSVRDFFLNLPIKDYDIEVFGLKNLQMLEDILSKHGEVRLVGKSFGVLKFFYKGEEFDFSFPRREQKVAKGHRGFEVMTDPFMEFDEAAKRRDFTINAMGYEIKTGRFIDPYGGREDLRKRVLRHINDKTFVEDPLRVYRGVQFCARFDLVMDLKTKNLCKEMVEKKALLELPKERVFEEIKKLLLKSKKVSIGFELLKEIGAIGYFFKSFESSSNKWQRFLKRIDFAADLRSGNEKKDLVMMFCAICMDMNIKECEEFIKNLTFRSALYDEVVNYLSVIKEADDLFAKEDLKYEIKKLSLKVCIEDFIYMCKIFYFDDEDKKEHYCKRVLQIARELKVSKKPPAPFVLGRDLINMGFSASPKFKEILAKVYELQLQDKVHNKDEALALIKKEEYL